MSLIKNKSKSNSSSSKKSGQEAHRVKPMSRIQVASKKMTADKPILKKNQNLKSKNLNVQTKGITDINFGQVASTVMDTIGTAGRLAGGDVSAILDVPNTVMKIINTTSNVVSDLKRSDVPVPDKVIGLSSENLNNPTVQNDKILTEVKKYIPVVNMSSIPSSYANSVSIPPITRKDGILKNGQRYVNMTGSNMARQVTYSPINANTMLTVLATRVHPNIGSSLFGTRLQTLSQTFQKWRLNKFVIQYIPTQKTSEPGSVYMTVKQGTDLTPPPDVQSMSQNELFSSNTAYSTGSLTVPGNSGWYYTATDATTDFKFFTTWSLFITTLSNISTIVPVAGEILIHYDVDFAAPVGSPNSNYYLDIISKITTSRLAYAPTDLVYRDFLRLGIKLCSDLYKYVSSDTYKSSLSKTLNSSLQLVAELDVIKFQHRNSISIKEFCLNLCESGVFDAFFENRRAENIRFTFKPLFERVFQDIIESFGPFIPLIDVEISDHGVHSLGFVHRVLSFILLRLDESVSNRYGLDSDSEEESEEEEPDEKSLCS